MRSFKKSMELYRELMARAEGKNLAGAAHIVFGKKRRSRYYEEKIYELGIEFNRQLDILCGLMPDSCSIERRKMFKNKEFKVIAMAMCLENKKSFLPFILADASIFKALTAFCLKDYIENSPNVIGEQYVIFDYRVENKAIADYAMIKEGKENIRSPFYLAEEILLNNCTDASAGEVFNVRYGVRTDLNGGIVVSDFVSDDKARHDVFTGIRVASFE